MNNKFSIRLKEALIANGISQSALAKELQMTQQGVNNWVLGKSQPDYDTLMKIAYIVDESIDYLLGYDRSEFEKEFSMTDELKKRKANYKAEIEQMDNAISPIIKEVNFNKTTPEETLNLISRTFDILPEFVGKLVEIQTGKEISETEKEQAKQYIEEMQKKLSPDKKPNDNEK